MTLAVRLCYLYEAVAREPFPIPPPWKWTDGDNKDMISEAMLRQLGGVVKAGGLDSTWGSPSILFDLSLRSDSILQICYLCFPIHFAS
jgi:hypothetical protein